MKLTRADVILETRETASAGYFTLNRYFIRHGRFDGGQTPVLSREVFEPGAAIAVVLYDPKSDKMVFVEQFRAGAYAAGWQDCWLTEIVAGRIDAGDSIESAVHREAFEETGVAITRLWPVQSYLVSPGCSSERLSVFIGEIDASQIQTGLHGLASEDEDIRVTDYDVATVLDMLDSGVFRDATSLFALNWFARHYEKIRKQWLNDFLEFPASLSVK